MCGSIAAMEDMTKEEIKEYQERLNKLSPGAPETLAYLPKQRLNLIANLIVDKVIADQKNGAPLLRKIEQENLKLEND